jgi:hypothetical protein
MHAEDAPSLAQSFATEELAAGLQVMMERQG